MFFFLLKKEKRLQYQTPLTSTYFSRVGGEREGGGNFIFENILFSGLSHVTTATPIYPYRLSKLYVPKLNLRAISDAKSAKYPCFLMSVENKKPPLGGNTTPPYRHTVIVAQHRALELSGQGSQENGAWELTHTYSTHERMGIPTHN